MSRQVIDYLLGVLPEADRERVAMRVVEDPEFCAELESAEIEIIDRYARGELTSADANRVRNRLLKSEYGLAHLRVARALDAKGRQERVRTALRLWRSAAIAASIALCVFGSVWLWRHRGTADISSNHARLTAPISQVIINLGTVRGDARIPVFEIPRPGTVRFVIAQNTPVPQGSVARIRTAALDRSVPVRQQAFALDTPPAGHYEIEVTQGANLVAAGEFILRIR